VLRDAGALFQAEEKGRRKLAVRRDVVDDMVGELQKILVYPPVAT